MSPKIISVVTGASGFVGSHLVDRLISKGHHVKCILRKSSSLRWLENKPVEIINCGLFDKDSLKSVLKDADYLFHVAGVVKAKANEEYYQGNVETTKVLLDVVSEVNPDIKRVVIVSSQTACGPSLDGIPCTEETKEHPITRYGKSKLAQEQMAKSYSDRLPISIIRAVAVYGPSIKFSFQFAVSSFRFSVDGITLVEWARMFTGSKSILPIVCPNIFLIIIAPLGVMKKSLSFLSLTLKGTGPF